MDPHCNRPPILYIFLDAVVDFLKTRNSSIDEIPNVTFYDDIVHVLQKKTKKKNLYFVQQIKP